MMEIFQKNFKTRPIPFTQQRPSWRRAAPLAPQLAGNHEIYGLERKKREKKSVRNSVEDNITWRNRSLPASPHL
jgi:hypothetical protein